jgi:hypothetical protein
MKYPFEVAYREIETDPEPFVNAIFSSLESEFLVMPKGEGFVEYATFATGYENLKRTTQGFAGLDRAEVLKQVLATPICFIVLRAMMGFTPSEWAYVTTQRTETEVNQGFARAFDRKVRLQPTTPLTVSGLAKARLEAMIRTACEILTEGCPECSPKQVHRLGKADTAKGLESIRGLAGMGAPYGMLLYERFLGRPFAGHRDSVSELIGDNLESAIEEILTRYGVSFRKTKRAERIAGFDQAPDFIIPDEFNPRVVIEAKITEDDGTARDKVTRIQHLGHMAAVFGGEPRFEVIACIAGRGFGQRREDMKRLLLATRGKVFTLKTLTHLVECSGLREFKTKTPPQAGSQPGPVGPITRGLILPDEEK